jgi:hypothetical protein
MGENEDAPTLYRPTAHGLAAVPATPVARFSVLAGPLRGQLLDWCNDCGACAELTATDPVEVKTERAQLEGLHQVCRPLVPPWSRTPPTMPAPPTTQGLLLSP